MRIISLVPAWTEWVAALGALDELVGRSHACEYPDAVKHLPAVTYPKLQSSTVDTESAFRDHTSLRSGLYSLRGNFLSELEPDLILAPSDGDVLRHYLGERLKNGIKSLPAFISARPSTFKEVLDAALHIGKAIGRIREAMAYIGEGEKQVLTWRRQLGLDKRTSHSALPTVVCIESIDPITMAGRWVPSLVELAGGRCIGAVGGEPSTCTDWSSIVQADPDVLAVMASDIRTTRSNLERLSGAPEWGRLKAVREERVVAFDGSAYFNHPGPRLYRSIELLASALHPERFQLDADEWEMAVIRT